MLEATSMKQHITWNEVQMTAARIGRRGGVRLR